MTALAGIWHFDGRESARGDCERMLAAQQVYGRDGAKSWADGSFGLGRAIWRILPEDAYDHGPQISPSGRFALVADIRLDNREELAAALALEPARAALLCDAALLLLCIERWGLDAPTRIVGPYAFALWDNTEHKLFLARDPIGHRPLYYHKGAKFLAFSSLAKGMHALSAVPKASNTEHVAAFLALVPNSGSSTFFQSIERVEPGHIATVTTAGVTSQNFWQPKRTILNLARSEDYVEGIREQMDRATRAQLRGVTRVGAHSSAGLDSSSVAATAANRWHRSKGLSSHSPPCRARDTICRRRAARSRMKARSQPRPSPCIRTWSTFWFAPTAVRSWRIWTGISF